MRRENIAGASQRNIKLPAREYRRPTAKFFCGGAYDTDRKKTVLYDILDTPISPELLPLSEGEISQKTEEIIGPYELHDFFLYYTVRFGFCPAKILRMAVMSFAGQYDEITIAKWLDTFNHRFFSQQFKRSCMPDGPRVGPVSLSPRGGLCLPSDADYKP